MAVLCFLVTEFHLLPDYSYMIVFDVCDRIVCINIFVFNDNDVKNDDKIDVFLQDHPLLSYNVSRLMIKVQEDGNYMQVIHKLSTQAMNRIIDSCDL